MLYLCKAVENTTLENLVCSMYLEQMLLVLHSDIYSILSSSLDLLQNINCLPICNCTIIKTLNGTISCHRTVKFILFSNQTQETNCIASPLYLKTVWVYLETEEANCCGLKQSVFHSCPIQTSAVQQPWASAVFLSFHKALPLYLTTL